MNEKKINFGLVLCLILGALWLVFALHKQPQQTVDIMQQASKAQSAITTPIANAISKPKTAQASTDQIHGKSMFVPVLMYHHVGILTDAERQEDPTGSDLTVSPTDFEAEVKYLHDSGYNTISIQQLYDALTNGTELPLKPIVFTFDDGYEDVFANAIPILQKYGYTGTFAIATQLLGRPTYAVWNDVIAAQKSGMEIVSHTENHLDLVNPVYADYDLHREIFDSKQILEQKLGVPIDFFVYPYGTYNDKVLGMLKDAGYKMAFTTAFGLYQNPENLLTEPRVRVHGTETLDRFKYSLGIESRTAISPTNP